MTSSTSCCCESAAPSATSRAASSRRPPIKNGTCRANTPSYSFEAADVHPERRRTQDKADPASVKGTAFYRLCRRISCCAARRPIPKEERPQSSGCSQRARKCRDRRRRERRHKITTARGVSCAGLDERWCWRRSESYRKNSAGDAELAMNQRAGPQSTKAMSRLPSAANIRHERSLTNRSIEAWAMVASPTKVKVN